MKSKVTQILKVAAIAASIAAFGPAALAQLNVPYADGSDGALIISNNTVIDLSQAGTGIWTNTSANPGKGTYDSSQWAVVFKYSSVTISNGATLTFLNNSTHAPVVWLVSNNVAINGTLNLNGQDANGDPLHLTEPGPGGFRGGGAPTYGNGSGFGPGGGAPSVPGVYSGYYGNPQILPLIGGSGNGGYNNNGGAGGGAILVAAFGTITVNGTCIANGGAGDYYYQGGSGGGIRLVANQIQGNGTIQAFAYNGSAADPGRIRLEGSTVSSNLLVNPYNGTVQPANPPVIFPATNAPTVTIVSIGGLAAPADPKARLDFNVDDDLTLATTNSVTIQLQTANFPTNGVVNVYIKPRNATQTVLQATLDGGTTNLANWHVSTVLNNGINQGHTVIQVRAAY
jgi:hypothetical protein